MKATQLLILSIVTLCFIGTVHAEDEAWYAGVRAGQMNVDTSGFDDAIGVGGILGYKLSNTLGIEGGYTTTGEDADVKVGTTQAHWDIDVVAVHLAYRNEGNFYAKGKVGILYQEVSANIANAGEPASGGEFTYGIGAGWRPFKDIALELEYTVIESDVNFISFGINLGI
ncbi:MAG: hypothetical protein Tsb0026_20040 [Sulfuricaulis sp.]